MIFADFEIAAILSSRGSGTPTRPTFGSLVQNGKFAASAAWVAVSALNRVDLPTFGRPTMPQLKPMGNAAAFKNNTSATESRPLQASICGTDRQNESPREDKGSRLRYAPPPREGRCRLCPIHARNCCARWL